MLARYEIVQTKHTTERIPPKMDPWSSEKLLLFDFLSRLVVKVYTGVENKSTYLRNFIDGIFINSIIYNNNLE